MARRNEAKDQDREALTTLAYMMDNEADHLESTGRDVPVSDLTQHSFGNVSVTLAQFMRAVALAMRAFVESHLK